eukprot:6792325-Prymnesium_polylepis.1
MSSRIGHAMRLLAPYRLCLCCCRGRGARCAHIHPWAYRASACHRRSPPRWLVTRQRPVVDFIASHRLSPQASGTLRGLERAAQMSVMQKELANARSVSNVVQALCGEAAQRLREHRAAAAATAQESAAALREAAEQKEALEAVAALVATEKAAEEAAARAAAEEEKWREACATRLQNA